MSKQDLMIAEVEGLALPLLSENLMEKLKTLNYERNLLKEMRMKSLGRYYFLRSVNPGEQFFMFVSLCAWLIRLTGRDFTQPQEFDDPNAIISKIIASLQEMDIMASLPTTRLIQGAGPLCLYILDALASKALNATSVTLRPPKIAAEEFSHLDTFENDAEVILEKVEELNAFDSDESDDEIAPGFAMTFKRDSTLSFRRSLTSDEMNPVASDETWKMELERVLPSLKVVVKNDTRDWRAHLDQIKTLKTSIEDTSETVVPQMKTLSHEIGFALDKIESREKHLNFNLKNLIQNYRNVSTELSQLSSLIKQNDSEKAEKEQHLVKISEDLEGMKMQIEQKGNTMTDGSPLINLKKAIGKVKEEISDFDIKIGVMQHSLNAELMQKSIQFAEYEAAL